MNPIVISVIIPTFNEADFIETLLIHLQRNSAKHLIEIIVVDANSTDGTPEIAKQAGARVCIIQQKGRAVQMNNGAAIAKGKVLYFVHADTIPPDTFATDIQQCVEEGFHMGRYLSAYQSNSWLLKLNAWFSRFDLFAGMGGDQTLFICTDLFKNCGGFNNSMKIMEEFEFCNRARKNARYKIIRKETLISARKYQNRSWLNVQLANYMVLRMYKKGASQEHMVQKYRAMLGNQ